MTETQRRINEYKAKLPGLKERVVGVVLLLVMSFSMVVSASFAWYTLSQAPEVSMMSTTVAANGNLEIALAQTTYADQTDADGNLVLDDDGNSILVPVVVPPEESAVGDSSATEGNTLVNANTKWGNLVNLSDSSYGLQNISLRPARLNGYNLTRTPLYGATYSADGRVYDISENYMYATWKADAEKPYFAAGDESTYGVRAISSVKMENITGTSNLNTMQSRITSAYDTAVTTFQNIVNGTTKIVDNKSCMDALAGLIQIFAQEKADKMLADDPSTVPDSDYSGYVTYAYYLIAEFWKVLEAEGEALLYMANMQIYMTMPNASTETFKTIDELLAAYSNGTLSSVYGVRIDSLGTYKKNREDIQKALADDPNNDRDLYSLAIACDPLTVTDPDPVYWREISGYVGYLVDIPSTTIEDTPINNLNGSFVKDHMGLFLGDVATVVINKGSIADTEQRLGTVLNGTRVTIRLKAMGMNANVKANVYTSAEAPFTKNTDLEYSMNLGTDNMSGDAVAKDTYGMAIDFWVRTNVENSHLILEGNVLYEQEEAYGTNKNGEETRMYVMTDTEGGKTDVYSFEDDEIDEEGNLTGNKVLNWYKADTHSLLGSNVELKEEGCVFEPKSIDIVIGYQGENRVWENWEELLEAGFISEDNTTQGAGSCYIFYADNPTDQTRILDLLDAFTIAFIDEEGTHIATAKLGTEHAYAINGKVTVPLKLTSGTTYTVVDEVTEEESEHTSITPLEANEAKLITAIVYLDGSMLSNDNVLAAGQIEGRLNIQFGSSTTLTAGSDNELQQKYRTITAMVSAEVDGETKTSYNKNDAISYEYDGKTKTVTVTLTVEGDKPNKMSGFFVKSISQTQGTRTESQDFKDNGNGTWSATFELAKPGDYSFGSVIVDGAEYVFDDTPTVKIEGLAITSLTCLYNSGMIMTADNYFMIPVTAKIDADEDLQPSQVRAIFRGAKGTDSEGREFTALMSYDPETQEWSGEARIDISGTYNLEYLVLDGDYNSLADSEGKYPRTFVVYLGLTTRVWCNGVVSNESNNSYDSTTFEYTEPVTIGMQVKIYDNAGTEMPALTNVVLYYHSAGSTLDQDGMYGNMNWNASTGYYEGELLMKAPGIYSFDRLTVTTVSSTGNSTSLIYKAASSPVFTAISPEPPSYRGYSAAEYQFVPNGGATMSVELEYADAATVYAVIEDQNGKEYLVPVSSRAAGDGYYTFTFQPKNESGAYKDKQDGEWTLTKLCLQNVYANDQMYTQTDTVSLDPNAENYYGNVCYVIDNFERTVGGQLVTDEITTYIVQTVNVAYEGTYSDAAGTATGEFEEDSNTIILGKDTHYFMDTHTTNVTFTITDWNKSAIRNISDIKWTIVHGEDQGAKGGYTGGSYGTNPVELIGSGATYSPKSAETLQLAGTYTTKLTFSIAGTSYTAGNPYTYDNGPKYEVHSITPTVNITGISNTVGATINVDTTTTDADNSHTSVLVPTWSATNATVYFSCNRTGSGSACDPYRHNYSRPSVSITLTGYGNASAASLSFGEVELYNGTNKTAAYEWTGNGTVSRNVGFYRTVSAANDAKNPAGTITADTLVFTYNGVQYTFTVPKITINNPY